MSENWRLGVFCFIKHRSGELWNLFFDAKRRNLPTLSEKSLSVSEIVLKIARYKIKIT